MHDYMREPLGSNANAFFQTSLISLLPFPFLPPFLFPFLLSFHNVIIPVLEIIIKNMKGNFQRRGVQCCFCHLARGSLPSVCILPGVTEILIRFHIDWPSEGRDSFG